MRRSSASLKTSHRMKASFRQTSSRPVLTSKEGSTRGRASNAQNADTSSSRRVELKLDWCSFEAATYAVKHWHYSRSMPATKTVKIGVWEDDKFIGAVIFAWGSNQYLGRMFGLKMLETAELCR